MHATTDLTPECVSAPRDVPRCLLLRLVCPWTWLGPLGPSLQLALAHLFPRLFPGCPDGEGRGARPAAARQMEFIPGEPGAASPARPEVETGPPPDGGQLQPLHAFFTRDVLLSLESNFTRARPG